MLLHEGDSLLKVVKKVFVIFLVIIGQFYNIIYSNVIARGRQFIESREEGICDLFGNNRAVL